MRGASIIACLMSARGCWATRITTAMREPGSTGCVKRCAECARTVSGTGNQTSEINTAFQLASMAGRRIHISAAQTLLMIPDFFQFLLSGAKRVEYTEAATTEL